MNWRITEHTADLGIEAHAPSQGACLAAAGLAMTSIITGNEEPHGLGANHDATFHVEAPDAESLAVAFLSELVWLADSKGVLWTGGGVDVEVTSTGMHRASAHANMVNFDASKHGRGVEVKAVTYHNLLFARQGPEWQLRVLLDI